MKIVLDLSEKNDHSNLLETTLMSSSSSDFRSLGDLLDPNCPIARQAEAEARQEAEQIERIRKAVAEREASRARWDAMTKEEKEEAIMEWDGYPEE